MIMHQSAAPTDFDTTRQTSLRKFRSAALPIAALLIAVITASFPASAQTAGRCRSSVMSVTPTGTSNLTVTANSGSIVQSFIVARTVK